MIEGNSSCCSTTSTFIMKFKLGYRTNKYWIHGIKSAVVEEVEMYMH